MVTLEDLAQALGGIERPSSRLAVIAHDFTATFAAGRLARRIHLRRAEWVGLDGAPLGTICRFARFRAALQPRSTRPIPGKQPRICSPLRARIEVDRQMDGSGSPLRPPGPVGTASGCP